MQEFFEKELKAKDLPLDQITKRLLDRFYLWLRSEYKVERCYLTVEELDRLAKKEFTSERLEKIAPSRTTSFRTQGENPVLKITKKTPSETGSGGKLV